MKTTARRWVVALWVLWACSGCARLEIPTAEQPAEVERTFASDMDTVWDAVLKVVELARGTIVTQDRASGLLVYSLSNGDAARPSYLNVYLRTSQQAGVTLVNVLVHTSASPQAVTSAVSADRAFFSKLESMLGAK